MTLRVIAKSEVAKPPYHDVAMIAAKKAKNGGKKVRNGATLQLTIKAIKTVATESR
jgi:hypothetical protein